MSLCGLLIIIFESDYGAEDITILKDGLAFLSTVCELLITITMIDK